MDVLQRAHELYAAGRMHDALEAAQAACDRSPKDAQAWWLLGAVSRHLDLPAASDDAFRRAAALKGDRPLPHRVSPERFREIVAQARAGLSPDAHRRLASTDVRVAALPSAAVVRDGVDPDALTRRLREPQDILYLFQVNHENRSIGEKALRTLVARSLSRA